MVIELAKNYGFCFGVKRAIEIAQSHKGSTTYGPLIHNKDEIGRLKKSFNVSLAGSLDEIEPNSDVVIRTHGIPKEELQHLKRQKNNIIDATCPYVTTPQQIVEKMSKEGYSIVIFGDKNHPEIRGVVSYVKDAKDAFVVASCDELEELSLRSRVAVVSQTTRKPQMYAKLVSKLMMQHKEVRVFNTICNTTFENQEAAADLARECDVMVIIGGKHSSNTKQLHSICINYCKESHLVENEKELDAKWFKGKQKCGISAGASTPEWIVDNVVKKIRELSSEE